VLSHEFWQRRFGGDPEVIGRTVSIGGEGAERRTVIGIMPPDYRPFAWRSEIYVPLVFEPGTNAYTDMSRYTVTGRLRDGVTLDEARGDLRAVLTQMMEGEEGAYIVRGAARSAEVVSYLETQVGAVANTLWVLLGAVGAVLLIACTNVANLLLARAGAREREMAIRTAMGAGRGRLVRQVLTESAVLGLAGGTVGVAGAFIVLPLFVASLPRDVPRAADIGVDGWVLVFALAVSITAGVLFGLAPALRSAHAVDAVLRAGANTVSSGRRRVRLNGGLVAVQVALCVVLVTGAGLLGKSLWRLAQVDPGFDAAGLYTMRLALSQSKYPSEDDRRLYYREALRLVGSVPGVERAGAIQVLPMTSGHMGVAISKDGAPVPDGGRPQITGYRVITPGYFEAMGIPLLEGRMLGPADRADRPGVGLINRRLADLLWPGESAVGREVRWSDGSIWFTVVGVVGNIHQHTLAMASRTEAYVPYEQDSWASGLHVMVRASTGSGVLEDVRRAVWSVDPDVPISREGSMEDVIGASMLDARFYTLLFSAFAFLALLLGAVGVYGVTSYTVSQRVREIGIRLALGAGRSDVMRSTLRLAMMPVLGGLLLGTAGAFAVTRLLSSLLFGVAASDPLVFGLSIAVLAAVAVAANFLPARRAAGVDPLISLNRG
jgi:putative ABC transport system permease protein